MFLVPVWQQNMKKYTKEYQKLQICPASKTNDQCGKTSRIVCAMKYCAWCRFSERPRNDVSTRHDKLTNGLQVYKFIFTLSIYYNVIHVKGVD